MNKIRFIEQYKEGDYVMIRIEFLILNLKKKNLEILELLTRACEPF